MTEILFSLALNGGGRFLSPSSPLSSLLCSLSRERLSLPLLSKLKYYGYLTGLLKQLTLSKLGFGEPDCLTGRSQRAIRWRVGEVANRVSCGSFRGGHWYLPIRNHDNRYFADWIRLCPGLSRIQKTGKLSKAPQGCPYDWSCGKSGQHWDWTIIAIWILPRRSSRLYKGKLIKMRPKMAKMDRE